MEEAALCRVVIMRLHHYDNLGTARFVTFSCYRRQFLLMDDRRRMVFLDELGQARLKYGFAILGYVVMPSHVHLVLLPQGPTEIGKVVGEIKSKSARRIGANISLEGQQDRVMAKIKRDGEDRFVFWQRRCYDHNCRSIETVREKINYCHINPVRAGLVGDPADWVWSSYRWYAGYGDCVLEIDGLEL
jgi:putative transposase